MSTWRELKAAAAQEAVEAAKPELLRRVALTAAEAIEAVDNWLAGNLSRAIAADALWRLRRALNGIGVRADLKEIWWRDSMVEQLERAGWRIGYDGRIRRVMPGQRAHEHGQGQSLEDATSELDALRELARVWEMERRS